VQPTDWNFSQAKKNYRPTNQNTTIDGRFDQENRKSSEKSILVLWMHTEH